ncbi:MAG TPA: signal peptidase I [Terrimesophilobacter sp.]|nr:signal peptidase I [Terrimesophilobacter sp.]
MSGRHEASRRAARPTKTSRGLLGYLGWGLSAGLLAFVALIGVLAIVVPAATGATPMTVLTGSMTPTYPPGTLIVVKPIDAEDIRVGTPIAYQLESGKDVVVTHRVVSITTASDGSREFTTRGDANAIADEKPVRPVQVRGEVWYSIPYLGWVNTAVNGESRVWIIPVIAGGLFLYAGYAVASSIASARKRRRVHNLTGNCA